MAVDLVACRQKQRLLLLKYRKVISVYRLRLFAYSLLTALVVVALRQLTIFHHFSQPDVAPSTATASLQSSSRTASRGSTLPIPSEVSVNLWRRIDHDCPPEKNSPDPALYGTGHERCFAIGLPDAAAHKPKPGDPATLWQMNSRALIYSPTPICLYGRSLQYLLSFEKRGAGTCEVVSVEQSKLFPAAQHGLNESCAAFRNRFVAKMYGQEMFHSYERWQQYIAQPRNRSSRHKAVQWESEFAIVIPKYDWSYNICHFDRIWNFVLYTIRNLHLFVPDADKIKRIDIKFRSGVNYKLHWHVGMQNATLQFLEREINKKITVGKLRFDYFRDFQCVKRGILLGREGRIDSFPFFNDTPVWRPEQQLDDSHWPVIPHDSLWFREAVYNMTGAGSVGDYTGPRVGTFSSIPLPARKVGILLRSQRSKRRLTSRGRLWFRNTLRELANKYSMQLIDVRTTSEMSFAEQVKAVRDLGAAVGLHGANMVNTVFMPPGAAIFEIFPWRYVRYYYAGGGNSGLRYSFHEPAGGMEKNCSFLDKTCFMKYRESVIYLTEKDRIQVRGRLEKVFSYLAGLHRRYPQGRIPLRREGNVYHFER